MPPRVHLESISPQLDEDNQLGLKMTVAGDSRDRALELARKMEESRRFAQTQITTARSGQSTTGDTETVEIVAIYIPEPLVIAGPEAQKLTSKPEIKSGNNAKPKNEVKPPSGVKPKAAAPKVSQH
jgi:hypothetical protein